MPEPRRVTCPNCSARTDASKSRCRACGVRLEAPPEPLAAEVRDLERGFSFAWCGVSLLIATVLTAAILVGVPMVVPALDFEGSAGMLVAIPVWFVSGMLVGLISPGKTFLEPVVATLLVAAPTAVALFHGQTVKTMPAFVYALMSALGVVFSLIGSYAGERIQLGPSASPTE